MPVPTPLRVRGAPPAAAPPRAERDPAPAPHGAPTPSFREVLAEAVRGVVRDGHEVDRIVRSAERGAAFSNEELLSVQVAVYRHTYSLELASKLIDKASSSIRQTLQSQQ